MWQIQEHKKLIKVTHKLPVQAVKKYELWKNIVYRHGPEKLKEFNGFHDEKLTGDRDGQRSSRLSLQYRVIYEVDKYTFTVYVIEIIPHNY